MATNTQQGGCKYLWADASLDFASSATLTSDDQTMTVTGAAVGDPVSISNLTSPAANTSYFAFVSAADTVTVRFCNFSGGTINPAAQTVRACVQKLVAY